MNSVVEKWQVIRKHYLPLLTADVRVLPNFICVGGQKFGTTTLYSWLKHHPDVCLARVKETWFFDKDWHRGIRYYKKQFPLIGSSESNRKAIGDVTPSYLFHPQVPERIQSHLPDVKLIFLLREPAERAYSHFLHMRRIGIENQEHFQNALALEGKRIGLIEKDLASGNLAFSKTFDDFGYRSKGIYIDQLARFANLFPKETMLIVHSQDLREKPESALREIESFLGINHFNWGTSLLSKSWNTRHSQSKADDDVISELREFYRGPNERLAEFLKRDFGWNQH